MGRDSKGTGRRDLSGIWWGTGAKVLLIIDKGAPGVAAIWIHEGTIRIGEGFSRDHLRRFWKRLR